MEMFFLANHLVLCYENKIYINKTDQICSKPKTWLCNKCSSVTCLILSLTVSVDQTGT